MELTPEQQAILDGSKSEHLAKCLRWLVQWGDVCDLLRIVLHGDPQTLLCVRVGRPGVRAVSRTWFTAVRIPAFSIWPVGLLEDTVIIKEKSSWH